MAETLAHFLVQDETPTRLPFDKHLYFGRADGNSFVVKDIRVSRQHAELYWDGSTFVLIDLGSSNGSYVNNERITTRILRDGDEIQIGMQLFKYRTAQSEAALTDGTGGGAPNASAMVTAEMPNLQLMLPDNDFNGMLGAMSALEICQMLELGARSGILLISSEAKEKGTLYFLRGQIVRAECGARAGEEAALHVLRIRKGSFSFRAQHPKPAINVTQKTSSLLLEAARLGDEAD